MGDTNVLAKLSEGDTMAREACHHKFCMDSFANRYRSFVNKEGKANRKSQQNHESIALAETMIYLKKLYRKTIQRLLLSSNYQLHENIINLVL